MRKSSIKKWIILLISFVFIVLSTCFFGYNYVRMVAHPKNDVSSETNNQDSSAIRLNLSSFDYWTCQVGVYQSEDNALQEKKRLEELGWEVYILSQNPWNLCIGYSHSKEELTPIREELRNSGVDAFPKRFEIPERSYWIRGKGAEETAKILQAVHDYLKSPQVSLRDVLSTHEDELMNSFPKSLKALHEASLMVIKAEESLEVPEQMLKPLRLLREYEIVLELLQS